MMQQMAAIALTLGLLLSVFNWATLFLSTAEKRVSAVPLVGGALLIIGSIGFATIRPYWWLAAIIDWGTLTVLLFALPALIHEAWAHSDRNTAHTFATTVDDRTVRIRLFCNGDSIINISFDPPRPYGERGNRAVSLGLAGQWLKQDEHFRLTGYAGERTLRISPIEGTRYRLTENGADDNEPSIYDLDGIDVDA